jgi:hypothetical protein
MTTPLFRLLLSALILCTAGAAGAVFLHKRALTQATELVMQVNAEALGSWNPQPLLDHAADTLLDKPGAEFYGRYFTTLQRRLGALQQIHNIQFTMELGPPWQLYRRGSAEYTMQADFANGYANIKISLQRQDNRWCISNYLVLTPLLSS